MFVLIHDEILFPSVHAYCSSQTLTFSVLKKLLLLGEIASVHDQALWGIDWSDFVGEQLYKIHIILTLPPLAFHQRLYLPQFFRHPWSEEECECKLLTVFKSCPGSSLCAWSCFPLNWMLQRSPEGPNILILMWIDCHINPLHFKLSGIWEASAISP